MWMNLFNTSDPDEVAKKILQKREVVVLTGAGISTESGIADFRSPGGIWSRYDFTEYATIGALMRDPEKVYGLFKEFLSPLKNARPNPAHVAIAQLEEVGIVKAIITQNVDNLHQIAGSKKIVELHGNAMRSVCMGCRKLYPTSDIEEERYGFPPRCPECNNLIKPDVILFGEILPEEAIKEAYHLSMSAKIMLVVGTSGEVIPAAHLPYVAKQNGADIIEINMEPTALTRGVVDYFLQGRAGEMLSQLCKKILPIMGV